MQRETELSHSAQATNEPPELHRSGSDLVPIAHDELCRLHDAAGEHASIAALLADRDEMTVYLKVEALLSHYEAVVALLDDRLVCDAPSDAYDIPCACCKRVARLIAEAQSVRSTPPEDQPGDSK